MRQIYFRLRYKISLLMIKWSYQLYCLCFFAEKSENLKDYGFKWIPRMKIQTQTLIFYFFQEFHKFITIQKRLHLRIVFPINIVQFLMMPKQNS